MIEQIQYFRKVVECQSFTKAADECFISQSAMSQQIRSLEKMLETSLIDRSSRKFRLTPAGEYFYENSAEILRLVQRLVQNTQRVARNQKQELTIGYLAGFTGPEIAQTIGVFSLKYPDLPLSIECGSHEELYQLLVEEKADLLLSDQRRNSTTIMKIFF